MPNGRCRLHGGGSPGAPKGNKNAFRHGRYDLAEEELGFQKIGTGAEVALRHIVRKANEVLGDG